MGAVGQPQSPSSYSASPRAFQEANPKASTVAAQPILAGAGQRCPLPSFYIVLNVWQWQFASRMVSYLVPLLSDGHQRTRGTLTHTNLTISPPPLPRHGIQTVTQHAKQRLYQQKYPQPFYFERASPSVAQAWHLSLALSSLGHLGFPNPPPHPSSNPTTPNPQAPISPCSGHGLFLSEILQKALSFGSELQRAS